MIKFIPYNPEFAGVIEHYYNNDEYSHFSRYTRKLLNKYECENIETVTGNAHFLVMNEDGIIGLLKLVTHDHVCHWGLAIKKDFQGKKLSYEIHDEMEKFCKNKIGSKILYTEILAKDEHLGRALASRGHTKVGLIPKYHFCDGEYCDVEIYYKGIL